MSSGECDQDKMVRQVNLAAAFHDHISCTKLPSGICGLSQDNGLDVSGQPSAFAQSDHLYATDSKSIGLSDSNGIGMGSFDCVSDEHMQIQRLKDMILVQLDLIQHQQEQLLKKDRQLQGLKQDREALCLRLEKMEKRVAVLTSRLAVSVATGNAADESQSGDRNELTAAAEQTPTNVIGLFSDPSVFAKIYSQSTSSSTPSSVSSSQTQQQCNSKSNMQVNSVRVKKDAADSESNLPTAKSRKRSAEAPPTNKKRCKSTGTSTASEYVLSGDLLPNSDVAESPPATPAKCATKTCKKKLKKCDLDVNNKNLTNKDFLTTDKPYDITINANLKTVNLPPLKASVHKNKKKIEDIEVPAWRVHQVSSCYSMEGTENLDDDVFNRRHYKLEVDERRRKRWDIQRLREQRHNERLRTGRYYSGSLGNYFIEKGSDLKRKPCDFASFFPEPKDVQQIEVTDKIPVIAFGHPIPRLPQKNFSLPWNINCEKGAAPTAKSLRSVCTSKRQSSH